jgi:hypothetical protein
VPGIKPIFEDERYLSGRFFDAQGREYDAKTGRLLNKCGVGGVLRGWTGRGRDHQGEMKVGLGLVEACIGGERKFDRGWSKLDRGGTKLRPGLVEGCIGAERSFDHGWLKVASGPNEASTTAG